MWVPQNQRPEDSWETLRSFQQSESYPLYKQQMPVCTPTAPTVDQTETQYVFGKKNDFFFPKSLENIILFCHLYFCPFSHFISVALFPLAFS